MNRLCIVTALAAETRPFLDKWQFRALRDRSLRAYSCDNYLLLQTGLGKLKAAASVAALLHSNPDIHAIVNIGIAGGAPDTGTLLLAHQVKDQASGTLWYPHLPDPRHMASSIRALPTTSVLTVDQPSSDYRDGVAFDMEASGIFSAATHYLSTSQIHSLKLIADNAQAPVVSITSNNARQLAQHTQSLIHSRFDQISAVIECISETCCQENTALELFVRQTSEVLLQQARHTHNDELQLQRLLEQLHTLAIDPELDACSALQRADTIRQHLQTRLSTAVLTYGNG